VRNKTEYFLQPDAARYSGRAISSNKKIKEVRSRGVVDVEQRKAKMDHNERQQGQQQQRRTTREEEKREG
jgi:hypothetical protein